MPNLATRIDGGICDAAIDRLNGIDTGSLVFSEADHKFVVEAIIATAVTGSARGRDLNRRLGDGLFSANVAAILARNPKRVTLYALPLAFLEDQPASGVLVADLFRRLHEARATKALSYPSYRNHEIDYVHQRLSGRGFFLDPFEDLAASFPWLSRDNVYGLTHVHFYNSDFCRRKVRYDPGSAGIVAALTAKARAESDHDVLLELMLCEISTIGTEDRRKRFLDHLFVGIVSALLDLDSGRLNERPFQETYHLLFLAWMYLAVRGDEFHPMCDKLEDERMSLLGRAMISVRSGAFMEFFADYAEHLDLFGPNPAIEAMLPIYGGLVTCAVDQAAGPAPLLAPGSSSP